MSKMIAKSAERFFLFSLFLKNYLSFSFWFFTHSPYPYLFHTAANKDMDVNFTVYLFNYLALNHSNTAVTFHLASMY